MLVLVFQVAACGPGAPADGTDGATGDRTSTTSTTTDGSFSATEQIDSSDSTAASVEFTCPNARWHEGNLRIDDATDLDAVRDAGGVTGSLAILETTTIVDLEFLSCLEIVDGSVSIIENDSLVNLHGLENLRMINGNIGAREPKFWDLGFWRNPALPRIDSLESLETIGILLVESNESLVEIEMPALRHVGTLLIGGYCREIQPDQPLASVGNYPVLEDVQSFVLSGQYEFTSLESLIELADRGVVFDEASFEHNYNLSESEIDAFAMVASITPETCSNMEDTEECAPCPFK